MNLRFDWDPAKAAANMEKHGVSFEAAREAFHDPLRIIAEDIMHSKNERRFHCYGLVNGHVLTVRFTLRGDIIRVFGAAYWRKGKKTYEQENHL